MKYLNDDGELITVLTVLTLLLSSIYAGAQTNFSIAAGVARTNLKHESVSGGQKFWEPKTSYFISLNLSRDISEVIGWQAGLGYINAGANSLFLRDVVQNDHYITCPISIYYKPFHFLKIGAGPQFNVLLSESINTEFFPQSFNVGDSDRFDYGVGVNAEALFFKNMALNIRNYWGLKYNNEYDYNSLSNPPPGFNTNKNVFLTLGLCYYLK